MDNDIAIRVSKICKTYKNITALKDIDLNIRKGELFGLIGPDGAGKTSLFRILTTLSLPDSGEATVDGKDIVRDYGRSEAASAICPDISRSTRT